MDFDGNIILLKSERNIGEKEIIEIIKEYGKPILICCDVSDPPETIRKIASYFGARLFSPRRDLSVEEKKELTKGYKYKNTHERDALASALYCLKNFEGLFKRIDKEVYEKIYKRVRDEIKRKILLGEIANIEEGIKKFFEKEKEIREVYIIKKSGKERELEEKVGRLRSKIKEYKREIERLRDKLKGVREKKEKEIVILDEKLKEKVKRLEKIVGMLSEELKKKDREIEKFERYIRAGEIFLEKLSEIQEVWRYLPKNIKIRVREIDYLNRKILKILKEISPSVILYSFGREELIKELEEEGFQVKKERLTKEDIMRIFST